MIASATPLGQPNPMNPLSPFAYVIVVLLVFTFAIGLFAGYLAKPRRCTLPNEIADQLRADGYLVGFNARTNDAYQIGFQAGYHQAIIDLARPSAPQPPPAAEQSQVPHQNLPDSTQEYATA